MKHKHIFTRLIAFAFALVLCFLCASCKKNAEPDSSVIHTTAVRRTDLPEYGNFIYYSSSKGVSRYNRKTGEIIPACMELECSGNDPLDCVMNYFAGVYDGRLYICGWQQYTHLTLLYCQDVATGEVQVLKTLSKEEDPWTYQTYIDQGYWYYTCNLLKSGGDPKNADDYEPYICRMTLDGQNDTTVLQLGEAEGMKTVADGKIVTMSGGILYVTDAETKERTELYNLTANGYFYYSEDPCYLNGKLYFLAKDRSNTGSSGYWLPAYLFVADIQSGTVGKLLEEPVESFCLTDDAVYYFPYESRCVYIPEGGTEDSDNSRWAYFSETLHVCDLNGKNARPVRQISGAQFSPFTVIDNVLYGQMYDFNPEQHFYTDWSFGSVNLATGEITRSQGTAEGGAS